MAAIIPRICPSDSPPGEAYIYHEFKGKNDIQDWKILHGLDIAPHISQIQGEADFVIIVPNHGVLVLEVKSHDMVKRDERGWWYGNSSKPELRGPFTQASSAMHSIRKYLVKKNPELKSVQFCSAVAFTHCDFDKQSLEWHPWQLINRGKLRSKNIINLALEILTRGRSHALNLGKSWAARENHPNPKECEAIVSILRPVFEVFPNPKAARKDMDIELLNYTKQQFKALDAMSFNRQVMFCGPAGSGKTLLAIESARRAHKEGRGKKTLLLCYNKLLGEEIFRAVANHAPTVTVKTIDSLFLQLAKVENIKDVNDASFWIETLPMLAFDKIADHKKPPQWDYLIMDEAQDILRSNYLDVLDYMVQGGLGECELRIFGDYSNQDIYSNGSMDPRDFHRDYCPSIAAFSLTENCRNSKPISLHVETLGGLKPRYTKILRADDGHTPNIKFYQSPEEQMGEIDSFLRAIKNEGFSNRDITILTPRKNSHCLELLKKCDKWKNQVAEYKSSAQTIRHCTIQAFKGLESPVILMVDIESLTEEYDQSIFYIGISRALHRLGILINTTLKDRIMELI